MRIIISSTKAAGTLTQCLGVASIVSETLSREGIEVSVGRLSWLNRLFSHIPFLSGWTSPAVVISCGSVGESRARRFLKSRDSTLWAHIEVPDAGLPAPDLVFVSHHDWRADFAGRPGYIEIHGVPHRIRPADIASARKAARTALGLSDEYAVVMLVGGPNPAFAFTADVDRQFADCIEDCVRRGARVFVSVSRRTDPRTIAALKALQHPAISIYDGQGANPYRDYLAAADAIFVTEDSFTMCCEALATGKPVSLLRLSATPGERLDKFRRFQRHFIEELQVLHYAGESLPPPGHAVPDDAAFAAQRIVEAIRQKHPQRFEPACAKI